MRFLLGLFAGVVSLATFACTATPAEEETAQGDQEMTASWFATNLPSGSADARAVLALVNDTSRAASFYTSECGLTATQASAIIAYRNGDEAATSADDETFDTLAELDQLPYTDATFWTAAKACAKRLAPPVIVVPPPPSSCTAPKDIGTVAGDLNADVITTTGACTTWVKVKVTEKETGLISGPAGMRLTATLTAPAGHQLTAFLYRSDSPSSVCSTSSATSTSTSWSAPAKLQWGEVATGGFSDGIDNTSDVVIQVKENGPCDPTAKWTLKLEGNK